MNDSDGEPFNTAYAGSLQLVATLSGQTWQPDVPQHSLALTTLESEPLGLLRAATPTPSVQLPPAVSEPPHVSSPPVGAPNLGPSSQRLPSVATSVASPSSVKKHKQQEHRRPCILRFFGAVLPSVRVCGPRPVVSRAFVLGAPVT